ncbi:MAG: S8 family serine peptidase, partial [Bacilli bacterium]|nr:S8 family serine peptidase [Bacilli bacterium]
MKKSRLLCGVIATMSLGTIGASTGAIKATEALEPDTRVIVKLKKDIDELTSEEALNQQENLLSRIRYSVNPKAELVNRFTVLINAMTLKVNEEDVAKIENLSGVEHVYKDNFVVRKNKGQGVTYQINRSASEEIDQNENVSARTMRMPGFDDGTGNILPGSTYEGEGTVIAILDNEFYFRGKVNGEPEWHHEVFDALDDSVKVRFAPKFVDRPSLKNKLNASMDFSKSSPTTRPGLKTDKPGEEGSLYFNSKVPFYFDYGGSTLTGNSTDAKPDFDVHSDIDYHGSHVASITAANAPEYKGIAPKAQLACMRVFTEYRADDISKDLGLSDSDGAYDSCILMALEDCITLGVDGINMSLGSDLGEFEDDDLAMQTIEKMVSEEKILTSISNGNAGKESYSFAGGYGNWTNEMVETGILGSYANHPTSMSIGSAHPDYIYYKTGIKCGESNIAYDD